VTLRRASLTKVLFVGALIACAAPAVAQDWSQPWADPEDRPAHVDLSVSTGFIMPTHWSSLVLLGSVSPVSGVLEQVVARDLRVEPDTEFAGAVTYWRSRYGLRTQLGFSRSTLTVGSPVFAGQTAVNFDTSSINIDTWLYDIRAAIGWFDYLPSRRVWPYGFIGLGGITYDLNRSVPPAVLTFVQRAGNPTAPGTVVVIRADTSNVLLTANDLKVETVFAFNFGAGTDLRLPMGNGALALRFEVSDHVAPSPVGLQLAQLSRSGVIVANSRDLFGAVHHLSATAGFVVQIGK
jgi:hypothetical protein